MKTLNLKSFFAVVFAIGISISSYSQHDHDHSKMKMNHKNGRMAIKKNSATTPIINAYLEIKNGLVTDNKSDAVKGAKSLLAAFTKFDMSALTGKTHMDYMKILKSAKVQAELIIKSPIDLQRESFETLSTDITSLITLLGTDKKLYQKYCPMKKASWISDTKVLKNPYYGAKMVSCGKMQKEIN